MLRRLSWKKPFLRHSLAASLSAGLLCLASGSAFAADYLAAEPMADAKVRVDGMLREWPAHFNKLKSKNGGDSGNEAVVGYDDSFIYVAAKITDSQLVRTKGGGQAEDRVELALYLQSSAGRGQSHNIAIYPGIPGKMAALVKVDGKKAASASAVEAPTSSGFVIEAKIPWSEVTTASTLRVGMRGKLTYFDASSVGRISSISTSGGGSGASMQPLTTAPETGLIQSLLLPKRLSMKPDREVYGNVAGKGGAEKVALYGHFLSIVGPRYKGGKQFYFNELDVESAAQITRLELHDFNGDGVQEIVLQKRLGKAQKYREVIQVLQIGGDGAPLQIFAQELALVTPEGQIKNKLAFKEVAGKTQIVLSQGQASGFEPGTFQEPTIGGGIGSALLPWQSVESRTFAWKGAGLTMIDEQVGEAAVSSSSASSSPAVAAPPPPRAPTADEMLERVYGLYKADRGVGRGKKPSFDFVTDVVGDTQMERVLVHDRDLVVFGKGFKQGLSYTYLTIGVKESKDILSVTTRDLVGDGKAEIIVHAVLNAQASESLGGDIVARQALFIYKIEGESLKRIFAAETGRSLKGNRILSGVAFIPQGAGLDIELRPLRALGWDQKSYPFPEDRHPAGGLEPLLLPWSTVGARHYSFDGVEYKSR